MDHSQKISEKLWNSVDRAEREYNRENEFIDDIIQKNHIERDILSSLDGISTVFDGGAGVGRFSRLLAKREMKVIHFDISDAMILKAQALAKEENVYGNIEFIRGALEDLSQFSTKSFDMVMSFDAPISYTYPNQYQVIGELARIAKKKIIISVSSRLGSLPYWANPVNKNQFILNKNTKDSWIQWCLKNEKNLFDSFRFKKSTCIELFEKGVINNGKSEIEEYQSGGTPWPITYMFMPDDLKCILEKNKVYNIEMAGPGAFARSIPNEILIKIMNDEAQRQDFLDFCYIYDKNQYVLGTGKDNLIAKGDVS